MSFESVMPPYNASDPHARFLAASSLDFLLIELVPMAYRVTNQVDGEALSSSEPAPTSPPPPSQSQSSQSQRDRERAGGGGGGGGGGGTETESKLDEDEERDAVFFRLESLGYRVGQGLVERFSRDRARFGDTLDVIKFVCKDLWTLVFRKQVDNLKTNHRVGIFFGSFFSFVLSSAASCEEAGVGAGCLLGLVGLPYSWGGVGERRWVMETQGPVKLAALGVLVAVGELRVPQPCRSSALPAFGIAGLTVPSLAELRFHGSLGSRVSPAKRT